MNDRRHPFASGAPINTNAAIAEPSWNARFGNRVRTLDRVTRAAETLWLRVATGAQYGKVWAVRGSGFKTPVCPALSRVRDRIGLWHKT